MQQFTVTTDTQRRLTLTLHGSQSEIKRRLNMTKEQIEKRINELNLEKEQMNTARIEDEKKLAVNQAESTELSRRITNNTWETSSKAEEMRKLQTALEIIER